MQRIIGLCALIFASGVAIGALLRGMAEQPTCVVRPSIPSIDTSNLMHELRAVRMKLDDAASSGRARPVPRRAATLPNALRLAKYDCQDKPALVRHLNGEAVIVEVGSFDGTEAQLLAPLARRLYVFEATPSKEQAILERVGGFGARVVLYMAAVGDVAGTAELHLPDGEGGAQQDSVSDQSFWTGKTKTIEVPMVRLDDVVAEHVDLLKIDAQGHDFRVLLGAETLIREHGVDIIHVEFAPRLLESAQSDPVAMLYWLRDRGYSCMDCDAFGPPGPFEARRFEDYPAAFSASAKDGREFGEWTDLLCYAIN